MDSTSGMLMESTTAGLGMETSMPGIVDGMDTSTQAGGAVMDSTARPRAVMDSFAM